MSAVPVPTPPAGRPKPGRADAGNAPGAGHRERLLDAMAASIREHGYRGTTVADVVRRARTSRRTFYQHFEDRDACFLELFDLANADLADRIAKAVNPDVPWPEQVDLTIGAYIDEVAAEPELALAFTHELTAIGDLGAERQRRELERFADLLVALVAAVGAAHPKVEPIQKTTAIMITGGLREVVAYGLENDQDLDGIKVAAAGLIKAVLDPDHRHWATG
jgi:AcrR family transcriptional regulator